jgi:lipid II:glycine glycyltransferase (peptidoglycan interpeptide bridge formation enzyme)
VVTWTSVADDEAARSWDVDLARLPGQSLVQTFGWGSYKAAQGWTPLRWVARDTEGSPLAMVQILVRTYPFRTVLVWCPGGLVGPIEFWNRELLRQIGTATAARHLYLRVSFTRGRTESDARYLRSGGWVPPSRTVSAPLSMVWDLQASDDDMLAGLRPNWRHNLHRAFKRNLRVVRWADPSPAVLERLFASMAAHKEVDRYFDVSSLIALFRSLDGRIVMYGCEDGSGIPLAVRACAVQHQSAWDLLAATSPEGRRCYASYAVLWALVRHCRALDVKQYDLSGVDPVNARGVYDFKRGTGAREEQCLGEWEWTTSPLLARAVNLGVRLRPASALS